MNYVKQLIWVDKMPTYTYKSDSGEYFDYRQSINDEPLEFWPKDVPGYDPENPKKVKRAIAKNVNVLFNGSGFYETDYKKSSGSSSETKSDASAAACSPASCACVN